MSDIIDFDVCKEIKIWDTRTETPVCTIRQDEIIVHEPYAAEFIPADKGVN